MTREDQVFIANVVVIGLTQETMASNVISQLASATVKLSTIVKICKYKGLHEGHHFILVVMEVHGTPKCDMDHFIKECVSLSIIDNWEVIYPCLFAFNFLGNMLVLFFNIL